MLRGAKEPELLWPSLFLGLCLLGAVLLAIGQAPQKAAAEGAPSYQGQVRSFPEPHGETLCASGCALSRHPTPPLAQERFEELLSAYAVQPMSEESEALEELLFYGSQSRRYLDRLGPGPLDEQRARFLGRELRRTHALVAFRLVDEEDTVRVAMPPMRVPLDLRHVFEPLQTRDFQPPEASGTVKRVGLHHIWQRI